MLVGGVVQHQVHDDANAVLLRVLLHLVEVGERAIDRIDVFVVGNVVAEIDLRRGIAGRDPDGVDAELLQVVELGGDAGQIADAVIVAVGKAARIDFVEDRMLPPLMTFGVDGGGF